MIDTRPARIAIACILGCYGLAPPQVGANTLVPVSRPVLIGWGDTPGEAKRSASEWLHAMGPVQGNYTELTVFPGEQVHPHHTEYVIRPVRITVNGTSKIVWEIRAIPYASIDPLYSTGPVFPGSSLNAAMAFGLAVGPNKRLIAVGAGNIDDGDNNDSTVGPFHAFKWVDGPTPSLTDLGTLGAPTERSFAFGISDDGTTIVGSSGVGGGVQHAFRIGGDAVMRDLGSLQGPTGLSNAFATNADGSIVVGDTTIALGMTRAFRWVKDPGVGVETGTMTSLGTLGLDSNATSVNADGSVVVGGSQLFTGVRFEQHAFRWTQATGMVDIGVLPGQVAAMATDVSDNGKVVVGISDPLHVERGNLGYSYSDGDIQTKAFRWTEATGIKDLQQLLVDGGVDMTGIRLFTALGVSGDGRFISGEAHFDSVDPDPLIVNHYILCYADAATDIPTCPAGAITTPDSQTSSLGDVETTHAGVVNHTGATAGMLLGSTDPMEGPSSATALGAIGSLTVGVKGRYAIGDGLTILGGIAYSDFDAAGLRVGGALIAATGLRFVFPAEGRVRPFVEAGAWGSPQMNLAITRTYMNGAGTATGTGTTTGSIGSLYVKGGVIWTASEADEIALSGTAAVNLLSLAGYTEAAGATNPFPATYSAINDVTTSIKATIAWTHEINERIDLTLSASLGETFGIDPVTATVAGAGALTSPGGNYAFGELSARIGYKVSDDMTVSGFLAASMTQNGGTHVQAGIGVTLKF
jgi:probable HAF family extracellular repeat protein